LIDSLEFGLDKAGPDVQLIPGIPHASDDIATSASSRQFASEADARLGTSLLFPPIVATDKALSLAANPACSVPLD
jgi:hypothetical protein